MASPTHPTRSRRRLRIVQSKGRRRVRTMRTEIDVVIDPKLIEAAAYELGRRIAFAECDAEEAAEARRGLEVSR